MKANLQPRTAHGVSVALLVTLWCLSAGVAQAQTCSTNNCTVDMTDTIYVMNNIWGEVTGTQSITVNSPTSWSTTWNLGPGSNPFGVKSYAAAILGWMWGTYDPATELPQQLSSHTPINTSVTFNYVPDAAHCASNLCRYDIAYDIWMHDNPNAAGPCDVNHPGNCPKYELMIWMHYSNELFDYIQPQHLTYATLGGIRWKVFEVQGGSGPNWTIGVFMAVDQNNAPIDVSSATLNVTDFSDWLINNSCWNVTNSQNPSPGCQIPASWWVDSVQFGPEIYAGKGTLNVTNFTAVVGGSPGPVNGPVSINAGGAAAAPFVADTNFSGGTAVTNWTGAIDTSAVTDPAPQAVYQSERYGAMTYTVPGLTPSAHYTVRLHFAENFFTAAGQRQFNVAINGTSVLSNFDVFATAGAAHKAVVREFTAPANGSGQIAVAFSNVVNNALVNGVEVLAPFPIRVNSGGAVISPYGADAYFSGGTAATNWTGAIDTSGVTDPAPQAVYQSERYGATTYTIPGLTPTASYDVRLHFAENFWTAAGQRRFNVAINGTTVLTNFDIFAAAGAAHKAVVQGYTVAANPSGQIVIALTNVVNNALINGIEVLAPTGSGNTHSGAWALREVAAGTPSFKNVWQYATVAPSSPYVASCWLKGSGTVNLRVLGEAFGPNLGEQIFTATASWQQVSVNLNTGGHTQVTFDLYDGGAVAGTMYIDDCFLGVAGGANMLSNPGFESGSMVWIMDAGAPFTIVQNP